MMDALNELGVKSKDIQYFPSQVNSERVYFRNQAILRLVQKALEVSARGTERKQILDLASGRGELLKTLSEVGYSVKGLDFDPVCVKLGEQYATCIQGDAFAVDTIFSGETFDLVVCSHFLEHTENPRLLVEKIKRVSKRYIVLAVPNLAQLTTLEYRKPKYVNLGHFCGWDPSHFKTFLELHCELNILEWECDQVILPPQLLWERIKILRPLIRRLEVGFLPRLLPYIANSLIVLCEKRSS